MAETLQLIITADNREALQAIEDLAKGTEGLKTQFKKVGSASNEANQALINSGRVLQDLNYGFMGIANNINPLLESYQRLGDKTKEGSTASEELKKALMGPAGLGVAVSALIFIFLKFGDAISNYIEKITLGRNAVREETSAFEGAADGYKKAYLEINKLGDSFKQFHEGTMSKKQVLDEYNSTLGKVYGTTKDINVAEKIFTENTENYIQAAYLRAAADIELGKAAEQAAKAAETRAKPKEQFTPLGIGLGVGLTYGQQNYKAVGLAAQSAKNDAAKQFDEAKAFFEKVASGLLEQRKKFLKLVNEDPEEIKKPKLKKEKKDTDYIQRLINKSKEPVDKLEAVGEDKAIEDSEKKHQEHLNWLSRYYKFKIGLTKKDYEENQKTLKEQEDDYKSFAKTVSTDVVGALEGMYQAMQQGQSFGDAFISMLEKMTEQLLALVLRTIIFQAIMAELTGGTSLVAGAATGGVDPLSLAGKILKIPMYAEGGITTRPHIGMIGEAGPEAIMPLDKLKGFLNTSFSAGAMSGGTMGSGGEFTLKGNDLVLALQRSNYSLNLRRGI